MAASWKDCIWINETARSTRACLFTWPITRRFLPYFIKVKELIDSGELGKLLFVAGGFSQVPPRKEDYLTDNLPCVSSPNIRRRLLLRPGLPSAGPFQLVLRYTNLRARLQSQQIRHVFGGGPGFAELEYPGGLPLHGSWCFTSWEGTSREPDQNNRHKRNPGILDF